MTNDQINVAIAEACGWGDVHFSLAATDEFPTERQVVGIPPKHCTHDVAPNYCANLNAMHEAEKTLGKKLSEYGNQLCEMTIVSKDDFPECYIWHATARQRAEAFLRTLGKWEPTTEESSAVQAEEQPSKIAKMEEALKRIRDCDWVITLPDRMDAVREIAREALE